MVIILHQKFLIQGFKIDAILYFKIWSNSFIFYVLDWFLLDTLFFRGSYVLTSINRILYCQDKITKMCDQQLGSLIKWLDTFELESTHSTPEEISDGVALAEALSQIAPEWFTAGWRAKIKTDVGTNWRLKVSNLKKIVEAVTEYYVECLNQQLSGYVKPDATKIGEHCDTQELRRLLQLILGCAVNCNQKQQYITRIMGLEEVVQQVIMQSIQELEESIYGSRLSLGASLNFESFDVGDGAQQKLLAELQMAVDSRDQLAQRCHELDQQLSLLQEEKATLYTENKKMQERLDELESPEEIGTSFKYSSLRKQVEELKDEMFKLETSRDDYRLKMELLEKEVLELQSKQEDLQKVLFNTIFFKWKLKCLFLNLKYIQYLKNLKIFLWKKRRFRLRWDSSPGLSIAGRLL